MTQYRLYFLNAVNAITDTVDVECETEAQAFAAAWDLADGGKVEIWQEKRRVGVFDPPGPARRSISETC